VAVIVGEHDDAAIPDSDQPLAGRGESDEQSLRGQARRLRGTGLVGGLQCRRRAAEHGKEQQRARAHGLEA
jgi:hypothetical protein